MKSHILKCADTGGGGEAGGERERKTSNTA